MSLLPPNSTKFERNIAQAIDYKGNAEALAGFKFSAIGAGDVLDWEYSLAQINIEDFQERVLKGLEFHRIRGTPKALRSALSWYGFTDVFIEEESPGEHFAEFQIGLSEIPNGFGVDSIISAADFSAPLRSKLSRMYNSLYDVRRFVLDGSKFGDFLSDDSGVRAARALFRKRQWCNHILTLHTYLRLRLSNTTSESILMPRKISIHIDWILQILTMLR